jgi:hypothetical protein
MGKIEHGQSGMYFESTFPTNNMDSRHQVLLTVARIACNQFAASHVLPSAVCHNQTIFPWLPAVWGSEKLIPARLLRNKSRRNHMAIHMSLKSVFVRRFIYVAYIHSR